MTRPNTKRDHFDKLTSWLSRADIERAVADYLSTSDRNAWMKDLNSSRSKRYFLIWQGEPLDAKAMVKAALRDNGKEYKDWHTDPLIDLLEHLDMPIWDEQLEGDYDRADGLRYESLKRLARAGQGRFRYQALNLWDGRCAISGVSDEQVLEAAHLRPHAEDGAMSPRNSIVLRVDLHRLFDAGMMAVHPQSLKVQFGKGITCYDDLANVTVDLPDDGPSQEDFEDRWAAFTQRRPSR